jgi:hypothetical protein
MSNRKKVFWGIAVLSLIAVLSPIMGAEQIPKMLLGLAFLFGFGWIAWRIFVAFILFTKPVRDKLKPVTDPLNEHISDTLHRSGLGKFSDAAAKFDKGVYAAVDGTQKAIDARNK